MAIHEDVRNGMIFPIGEKNNAIRKKARQATTEVRGC